MRGIKLATNANEQFYVYNIVPFEGVHYEKVFKKILTSYPNAAFCSCGHQLR